MVASASAYRWPHSRETAVPIDVHEGEITAAGRRAGVCTVPDIEAFKDKPEFRGSLK